MKKVLQKLTHIGAAALFCAALSCSSPAYFRITGYAQGGSYSVVCSSPAGGFAAAGAEALKSGIDSVLAVIDSAVNGYNPSSLLSRWNRGELSPALLENPSTPAQKVFSVLTQFSDSLHKATHGALDCRAAALYDVWGFGFKNGQMPSEEEVEAARSDRSKLNFNAVAQGYSADAVGAYLRRKGVRDMLVNIGGEMLCEGLNPSGKAWRIGIDAPTDGNDTPGENLSGRFFAPSSRRTGIVTSGNYRKYYIRDGIKYSHTVDPRSGRPVQHNLLSATVIAPTSSLADALATACMVDGFEKATALILSRDDLEAVLITADTLWCSPGISVER